jgi:hypothetical protein
MHEYVASKNVKEKFDVCRKVMEAIKKKGGKFYGKCTLNVPRRKGFQAPFSYTHDEDHILQKINTAFYDQHRKEKGQTE